MASYYAWDLNYPKDYPILYFLQKVVVGDEKNTIEPTSKFYLSRLSAIAPTKMIRYERLCKFCSDMPTVATQNTCHIFYMWSRWRTITTFSSYCWLLQLLRLPFWGPFHTNFVQLKWLGIAILWASSHAINGLFHLYSFICQHSVNILCYDRFSSGYLCVSYGRCEYWYNEMCNCW